MKNNVIKKFSLRKENIATLTAENMKSLNGGVSTGFKVRPRLEEQENAPTRIHYGCLY